MDKLTFSQTSYLTEKFRQAGFEYDSERLWNHLEELPENVYRYWLKLCFEKDVGTLRREVEDWLKEKESASILTSN